MKKLFAIMFTIFFTACGYNDNDLKEEIADVNARSNKDIVSLKEDLEKLKTLEECRRVRTYNLSFPNDTGVLGYQILKNEEYKGLQITPLLDYTKCLGFGLALKVKVEIYFGDALRSGAVNFAVGAENLLEQDKKNPEEFIKGRYKPYLHSYNSAYFKEKKTQLIEETFSADAVSYYCWHYFQGWEKCSLSFLVAVMLENLSDWKARGLLKIQLVNEF